MKKQAFSLVELSVVVLIIGILVAGISESRKLIAKSRLNTAKSLTENSIVKRIDGLVGWWETSLGTGFNKSEAVDGTKVSIWKDINPSATLRKDLVQATSANQPVYRAKAINDLPGLKFDKTATYLARAFDPELNQYESTIFLALRTTSGGAYGAPISNRDDDGNTKGYIIYVTPSDNYVLNTGPGTGWSGTATSAITFDSNDILTASTSKDNSLLYHNGTVTGSASGEIKLQSQREIRIGAGANESSANDFYDGYISEIIIFKKRLSDDEREAVEKYLGDKYNVDLG